MKTKEEKRLYNKMYNQSNKEKINQQKRAYYEQNAERIRAYKRDYYAENPEELNQRNRNWYNKNKEKHNKKRRATRANATPTQKQSYKNMNFLNNIRRKYGLSKNEYLMLFDECEEKCCICLNPETGPSTRLGVDHNHSNGKIRGLLCISCNVGLGNFFDNEDFLKRAIEYVNKDGFSKFNYYTKKSKRKCKTCDKIVMAIQDGYWNFECEDCKNKKENQLRFSFK